MTESVEHLLTRYLAYNPTSGAIIRKRTSKPSYLEEVRDKYFRVECAGQKLDNMRVAWFLHYGEYLPPYVIYPLDGDRSNTKLTNMARIAPGHKRCSKCGEEKPVDRFSNKSGRPGQLQSHCKTCNNKIPSAKRHKKQLKHQYNITPEAYEGLLAAQGGVCAICKKPPKPTRRLAVDHCHNSEVVRGLLCSNCNLGIGYLQDDPKNLARAIAYLTSV